MEKQAFLVLDGALATELEARGADLRHKLWSAKILLEQPELIRSVHLDYYRAGADVATTASYQATIPGLCNYGLSREEAKRLLRSSVLHTCKSLFFQQTFGSTTEQRVELKGSSLFSFVPFVPFVVQKNPFCLRLRRHRELAKQARDEFMVTLEDHDRLPPRRLRHLALSSSVDSDSVSV